MSQKYTTVLQNVQKEYSKTLNGNDKNKFFIVLKVYYDIEYRNKRLNLIRYRTNIPESTINRPENYFTIYKSNSLRSSMP